MTAVHRNEGYLYPPAYEPPPRWIPPEMRINHPDFSSDLEYFLPRTVVLNRLKASDALGFNIRGGKEHNFGLYVSKVMPHSAASQLGIKEGDQILQVNGINFSTMDHADLPGKLFSQAVKILKINTNVQMLVRYFPYGYQRTYGRPRSELAGQDGPPVAYHANYT